MNKADHIAYWIDIAADDRPPVQRMMAAGDYVQRLFFAHLIIEKLSKAHWVKDNVDNIPPRILNILKVWDATQLQPTQAQRDTANELNGYQLEGRYPDYLKRLRAITTSAHANRLFYEVTDLRTWLLNTLP